MPGESCQVFGIKCSINAAWRRSFCHTIYILLLTNQLPEIKIDTLERKKHLYLPIFSFAIHLKWPGTPAGALPQQYFCRSTPLSLTPTYPAPIIGKYVDVESTVRMVVFPRSTIFSRVVRLYVSSPRILENCSIFHTIQFFFLISNL